MGGLKSATTRLGKADDDAIGHSLLYTVLKDLMLGWNGLGATLVGVL